MYIIEKFNRKLFFWAILIGVTLFCNACSDFLKLELTRANSIDGQKADSTGKVKANFFSPELETTSVAEIKTYQATVVANMIDLGSSPIVDYGFCWDTSVYPTVTANKKSLGKILGAGIFSTQIDLSQPATDYYVRSYASNANGTSYGKQIRFKTLSSIPVVSSMQVSQIQENSVMCDAVLDAEGESKVSSMGFCWNLIGNPNISDSKVDVGVALGAFKAQLNNLLPNTTYYVRSFALSAKGLTYGKQIVFTTFPICTITSKTTGWIYEMQTPADRAEFNSGSSYPIKMFSSIYSIGQVDEVSLYLNDAKVYSWGNYLVLTNNQRSFPIPGNLKPSQCYNIRVFKRDGTSALDIKDVVYISPRISIYK